MDDEKLKIDENNDVNDDYNDDQCCYNGDDVNDVSWYHACKGGDDKSGDGDDFNALDEREERGEMVLCRKHK